MSSVAHPLLRWPRLTRSLIVLTTAAIVVSGCAQLMGDSIETLMKQGIDLLNAGQYDAAIAKFQEVVQRDPSSWNAYLGMTRAHLGKGSWGEAIVSGRKALALGPSGDVIPVLAEAFLRAGLDALGRRQFSDAVGHFLEYVRLKPTDVQGHLNLTRAYLGNQSWANAIASAQNAFELAPNAADVVAVLTQSLLGGGLDALQRRDFSSAISYFGQYVRLQPADWQGYLHLGQAYVGSRAYGDAAKALAQGLAQTSEPGARQDLARALLDGGRQALATGYIKGAIELLQEYVRHDPRNASAYLTLGKAYWQDGNLGNALAAFERVVELNPNEPEASGFLRGRR